MNQNLILYFQILAFQVYNIMLCIVEYGKTPYVGMAQGKTGHATY